MRAIKNFLVQEDAQDLIEYTLILAFVALGSAGLFMNAGGSTKGIWATAGLYLSAGASGFLPWAS